MLGTISVTIRHDPAHTNWGEDGLAGISDEKQLLCFSIALWNGNDPILKERLFGLTNSESIFSKGFWCLEPVAVS